MVKKQKREERWQQLIAYEQTLYSQGYQKIAGVDEVGRGPLAGPVVAAACILSQGHCHLEIDDSKKLLAPKRQKIHAALLSDPNVHHGLGIVSVEEIDQLNILQASFLAMQRAVSALQPIVPDFVLIDGNSTAYIALPAKAITGGDSCCYSIAAASIIAKVHRDNLMLEYHAKWPAYGFDKHKGYGTAAHLTALAKYGPCALHRRSFAPVEAVMKLGPSWTN